MTNSCWMSRAGGGGDAGSLTPRCCSAHPNQVQVYAWQDTLLRAKSIACTTTTTTTTGVSVHKCCFFFV